MKITLLANRDVASCLAVNYLLRDLQEHRLTLFLSSRVGSKPLAEPLQHLKFVEQDLFNQLLFPLLASTVRTRPADKADKAYKAYKKERLLGFDELAEHLDGGVSELNSINDPAGLEIFAASEPELVLSVRYGVILREAALAIPAHGVLNLHSGKLPDYKGVMATFWALMNNEKSIGATLHAIEDSSIDTGPIVAITALDVDRNRSYLWHVLELYWDGCRQMAAAVQELAGQGMLQTSRQAAGGNYYSFPSASDLNRFTAMGWRLFDPDDVTSLARRFLPQ